MSRRWFPRSLRMRLTALHAAAMVLVVTLYAAAVFALEARNASRGLDNRLRSDFRWAADMAQTDRSGALSWFESDEWQEDSPWLNVLTEDGEPIFRTALARRLPVPESAALARDPDGGIVAVPGGVAPFRILTSRALVGGQRVIIQVGRSEAPMRQALTELLLVLVLGLPLSVTAAGLGGYWLARGALAPVDRMAERARAITAERLGERLPVDNPADELGRLATVFNATLGRLEASFREMRRFTANVSHELRTPLTAIRSVGEVGLREPRDAAGYRQVIGSMLEDANRLASMVDRLLTLSRADAGDVQVASDRSIWPHSPSASPRTSACWPRRRTRRWRCGSTGPRAAWATASCCGRRSSTSWTTPSSTHPAAGSSEYASPPRTDRRRWT